MQLLIVADDLTGALDSAVTLAGVGLRCRVARRPSDVAAALDARPEVLAVSTASREGTEAAARAAIGQVLEAAAGAAPALLLKKVDSRLKGHVAAELRVIAERTGVTRALVAPAIPAQGRITEAGRLTGAGISAPIDIAETCAGSGLTLTIPDTRSDADLDAALAGALDGPPILLVGAAGLAAALGRRLRPDAPPVSIGRLPAPLVLAIGSRDPITLAQVEAARAAASLAEMPAPDGRAARQAPVAATDALLVQLVAGGAALDPREAGARFARTLADLLGTIDARTLFSCGGETTDAILGELGIGVLEVEGEFLPGIPVSTVDVKGRPMRLVTKSGGFGGADTLLSVIEAAGRGSQEQTR